jgi:hypothetical protein
MVEWREGLKTIPISWLLLFSYSMIIFINVTLIIVVVTVVFSFCVGCSLCMYFCVLCFVWSLCYFVWCVLCLIVVPPLPGENPFAVKISVYLPTRARQACNTTHRSCCYWNSVCIVTSLASTSTSNVDAPLWERHESSGVCTWPSTCGQLCARALCFFYIIPVSKT